MLELCTAVHLGQVSLVKEILISMRLTWLNKGYNNNKLSAALLWSPDSYRYIWLLQIHLYIWAVDHVLIVLWLRSPAMQSPSVVLAALMHQYMQKGFGSFLGRSLGMRWTNMQTIKNMNIHCQLDSQNNISTRPWHPAPNTRGCTTRTPRGVVFDSDNVSNPIAAYPTRLFQSQAFFLATPTH